MSKNRTPKILTTPLMPRRTHRFVRAAKPVALPPLCQWTVHGVKVTTGVK